MVGGLWVCSNSNGVNADNLLVLISFFGGRQQIPFHSCHLPIPHGRQKFSVTLPPQKFVHQQMVLLIAKPPCKQN